MTGTIAPQREFRQVDPLIARPPRPAGRRRFALPPIGFRPDIEGLRAIAVVLVVLFHADLGPVRRRLHRRRRVLRRLRVPDHVAAARRGVPHRHRVAAQLLGPPGPPPAAGVVPGHRGDADRRPVALRPAAARRPRPRGVAACGFVINYVFAWREAHGDGGYFDADLAKSPLLHFWSLAVEEQFYLAVAARHLDGWPASPRRLRHELTHRHRRPCGWLSARGLRLVHRQQHAVGVLLAADAGLGAADRRAAGRSRSPRCAACPGPSSLPMAVAGLAVILVAAVTYDAAHDLPRHRRGSAGARHGARHRRRLRSRGAAGRRAPCSARDRCCGSASAPTPSTCGTGRRWCSSASSGGRCRSPSGWPSSPARSVAGRRCRTASSRTRSATRPWLAARPRRSLLTGLVAARRHRADRRAAARHPPRRSGGAEAATLTLPERRARALRRRRTDRRRRPPRRRPPHRPPIHRRRSDRRRRRPRDRHAADDPGRSPAPQLADLIALQQQLLEQGLTTQEVPSNLHPSLMDACVATCPHLRPTGACSNRATAILPDCVYGNPDVAGDRGHPR